MKFDTFLGLISQQPYFDLATLVQLSGEDRSTLRTQLSRWVRAGKLKPLRRAMYALATPYRAAPINPAELANQMCRPSYLSGEWALGFLDMIPEMVVTYTSVTSRLPRRFANSFGSFEYRHIKQSAFFGARATRIQNHKVMLASPEKALLDYWYLHPGPWTPARMAAMRFQQAEFVDRVRLEQAAARFESPRLRRAVAVWEQFIDSEQCGSVQL